MTGARGGEPRGSAPERTRRGARRRRRTPRARRLDDAEAPPGATPVRKSAGKPRAVYPRPAGRISSFPAADIGIRPLKELVLSAFPEDHPLREVILAERDALSPSEFLAKLEVWTILLSRRT